MQSEKLERTRQTCKSLSCVSISSRKHTIYRTQVKKKQHSSGSLKLQRSTGYDQANETRRITRTTTERALSHLEYRRDATARINHLHTYLSGYSLHSLLAVLEVRKEVAKVLLAIATSDHHVEKLVHLTGQRNRHFSLFGTIHGKSQIFSVQCNSKPSFIIVRRWHILHQARVRVVAAAKHHRVLIRQHSLSQQDTKHLSTYTKEDQHEAVDVSIMFLRILASIPKVVPRFIASAIDVI